MSESLLDKIKRVDAQRPNVPGEHWLALATGAGLWLATRKHPSVAVRLAAAVAGSFLVARAASGRQVPELLQRFSFGERRNKGR